MEQQQEPPQEGKKSTKKKLDRNLEAEIRELFRTFDKDNDKTISTKELGRAMRFLGLNCSAKQISDAMNLLDSNGNGKIEYKEFLHFMKKQLEENPQCTDEESNIRAAFKIFDRDKNGYIDAKELKYAMQNLGEKMTDAEISDMMKQADVDGDGRINYEEFVKIWTEAQ